MSNRLAHEASPYLLQHKDNPVDWFPWGDEAFDLARREEKPILLSIGYAACHWCHVMERESFEDHATADLMNQHFVSIKVDREERPDIDSIYMDAVQAMTGHGGWPMTMFLTPDAKPFYGGTYFPPEDRHGIPSFKTVLTAVADAWHERRSEVLEQGQKLIDHMGMGHNLRASDEMLGQDLLEGAAQELHSSFDPQYGGFGAAPKFPQPMTIDFLLRLGRRGNPDARIMATKTLDAMAGGGMFDQLRGGFARYSVDREWIVPHFEKMLYDNAQLLRTYARAWVATKSARYLEVSEATANWLLDEMRDPGGGFWSSLDADSEGEEGKFYVWSLTEIYAVLGDDAPAAIEKWGFSEQGNFEGQNIPILASDDVDPEAVERARNRLLQRRSRRVRPATDTKVLTAWSAMAAAALAESGALLSRPEWIEAASEAIGFTFEKMRPGGRLMRSYRRGETGETLRHLAIAEDYAFLLEALLALFEATHQKKWLGEARWAADEAIRLFLDEDAGGFFTTGKDAEPLVVRPKDIVDNAVPSANSVLALELQRLALMTGDESYEEPAVGALKLVREVMVRSPLGFGHALEAADFYTSSPVEVVVVGKQGSADRDALLEVIHDDFNPNKVLIVSDEPTAEDVVLLPLLRDKHAIEGKATVFVCRNGTCKLPVTTPDEVREQLAAL